MKKKLCMVPFTKKEYALVGNLPEEYELVSTVTPKGLGRAGLDIASMKNRDATGIKLQQSILDGVEAADTVLITAVSKEQESLHDFARRALETAIEECKEILCFLELDEEETARYRRRCEEKKLPCHFGAAVLSSDEDGDREELFYKIGIPVLYVSDMIPGCDGYDVFLKLMHSFQRDGKKVLAVSEDPYNLLFRQPCIKFWGDESPRSLVFRLNRMIHDVIAREMPDVLLVRLPEPMIKYDDENPFDFGLTAFLASQALPGDGCICCTYLGSPIEGFWENVNENFVSKFGYPILAAHLSNQIMDMSVERGVSTVYVEPAQVGAALELMNRYNELPFYDLLACEDYDRFYTMLRQDLFDVSYGVIAI